METAPTWLMTENLRMCTNTLASTASCRAAFRMAMRACIGPAHPVPTSLPVWNTKTRLRGLLKASWTAANLLGA